jgi:S-adenosylmethionine:tRNA ribosyltransferase-isomerase
MHQYHYHLPPELIAQSGVEPRDSSRLLVAHRSTGQLEHRIFRDITEYLCPGDVLVLNQSRVIPARLLATNPQGTAVEVLLVRDLGEGKVWEALLKPAKRARGGLGFADGLTARVKSVQGDGTRVLEFSENVWEHLDRLGHTPLPPYIEAEVDPERYQTVYAKTLGSVAAPTAGLHFTPGLLEQVVQMGVRICSLTLHVGPGTFKPVKGDPQQHVMHSEWFEVPAQTAQAVYLAKAEGRRVVAVGTTTVRALESVASLGAGQATRGETQIFIRHPYAFKVVDALITNFHLPGSTLLMLVAALAGYDLTAQAYQTAVNKRYRFYSLGDAMLVI